MWTISCIPVPALHATVCIESGLQFQPQRFVLLVLPSVKVRWTGDSEISRFGQKFEFSARALHEQNFGVSVRQQIPVIDLIIQRFPATLRTDCGLRYF